MRYAAISLTANTIGSIALFFLFRHLGYIPQLGIAVATTLGGWLNAFLLWSTLRTRAEFVADARLKRNLPLIVLSGFIMAGILLAAVQWLQPYLQVARGFVVESGALAVLVGVGTLVYGIAILATGVMSPGQLARFTRRK